MNEDLLDSAISSLKSQTSGYGKSAPLGIRNNNPGNIRASATSFKKFETPEEGLTAAAKNIVAYKDKHGIDTVEGIINRWAPPSDNNNTSAYVASVSKKLGVDPKQKLDVKNPQVLAGLVSAITTHENGMNPYDDKMIGKAAENALSYKVASNGNIMNDASSMQNGDEDLLSMAIAELDKEKNKRPDTTSLDTKNAIGGKHAAMLAKVRKQLAGGYETAKPILGSQKLGEIAQAASTIPAALSDYSANVISSIPFVKEGLSAGMAAAGFGEGKNFPERYADMQQRQQVMREAGSEATPVMTEVGKGLAGIIYGSQLPGVSASQALLPAMAKGAATGAGYGALYGGSNTNSFLSDRDALAQRIGNAGEAIKYAAPVGAAAGALGYVVQPKEAFNVIGDTIKKPIKSIGSDVSALGLGASARKNDVLDEATQKMYEKASAAYQNMKNNNAYLNERAAGDISRSVVDALKSAGKVNSRLHEGTLSVLKDFAADISNGPISIEEIDQYRRLFSDVVKRNHGNEDALRATKIIYALDDFVNGIKPQDLSNGTPKAVEALNAGRAGYAQAAKFDQIVDLVKKADGSPVKLKKLLYDLSNNDRKLKGFTASEVNAIMDAAKYSGTENVLKLLGKFGIELGGHGQGNVVMPTMLGAGLGATLGSPTGVATVAGGTLARAAQKAIARGKVERILQEVEGRAPKVNNTPPPQTNNIPRITITPKGK